MDNKELEFELLTNKEDKRNKLITLTPKGKRDIFDCIVQRMEQQMELSCILVPILCMLVVCI